MSLKVGELYGTLGLDDAPFRRGLSGIDSAVGKVAKVAAGTAVGIAGAFAGGAALSLSSFMGFEKGMNEVFTLLPGITQEAMGGMREHVQELSADLGVMTDDMVPALYQSLSAGVPRDNVFEFLEDATKAGIAGVATTEDAVSALTTGMNIFGESAEAVGDALFTTVKLGVTTFPQLVGALGTVGPAAKASGVSLDELTASIATATKKIPDTAKVSTSLVQVFSELDKEGSKINDTLQEMGHKTVTSAKSEFGSFQGVLQGIFKHVNEDTTAFKNLFGSTEAAGVALTLVGEGAAIAQSDLDAMAKKAGATDEAFKTMDQGLGRSIDKIKANLQVGAQHVGKLLAPLASEAAGWIQGVIPHLQNFGLEVEKIWAKKDITVTAKLEASWDSFGQLLANITGSHEKAQDLQNKIEAVSHATKGLGEVAAAAGLGFYNLYLSADWAITQIRIGLLDLKEDALWVGSVFGGPERDAAGQMRAETLREMDELKAHADEVARKSQEMHASVEKYTAQSGQSFAAASEAWNRSFDLNLLTAGQKWDYMVQQAKEKGGATITGWGTAFGAGVPNAQAIINATAGGIAGTLATLPGHGISSGAGTVGGLAGAINAGAPAVGGAAQNAAGQAHTPLAGLPGLAGAAGLGATIGMASGMNAGLPGVDAAAASARSKAGTAGDVDLNPEGSSIIQSLISGMGSMFGPLGSMAAAAAQVIKDNKGPIEKDRVLLVPEANAIMDSLINTMAGRSGDLARTMQSITGMIQVGGGVGAPALAGVGGGGVTTNNNRTNNFYVTINAKDGNDAYGQFKRRLERDIRLNG